MAERVVVVLEAVEVEQREQRGLFGVRGPTWHCRSGEQLAAVAEAGQRVGGRLRPQLTLKCRSAPAARAVAGRSRARRGPPPRGRRSARPECRIDLGDDEHGEARGDREVWHPARAVMRAAGADPVGCTGPWTRAARMNRAERHHVGDVERVAVLEDAVQRDVGVEHVADDDERGFKRFVHRLRRLEALLARLLQCARDDRLEPTRDIGTQRPDVRCRARRDGMQDHGVGRARKRTLPCQHLVEHDA